jgi:hypothetical protein
VVDCIEEGEVVLLDRVPELLGVFFIERHYGFACAVPKIVGLAGYQIRLSVNDLDAYSPP